MKKIMMTLCMMICMMLYVVPIMADEIEVVDGTGAKEVDQTYNLNYIDTEYRHKYKVMLEWKTGVIDVSLNRISTWDPDQGKWTYSYSPTNENIEQDASFTFTNMSSKTLNVAAYFDPDNKFTLDDDFIVNIGENLYNDFKTNDVYTMKLGSLLVPLDGALVKTIKTNISIKDSKFAGLDAIENGVLGTYHFTITN